MHLYTPLQKPCSIGFRPASILRPIRSVASRRIHVSAATGASIDLHVNETTITFPLAEAQAKEIVAAINSLLQTFAAKQAAERPKRWQSMEYRYKGSGEGDPVALLELFCNPNAYSTAFDARVLVTLKAVGGVSVTTEGRLSAFKADIDNFLDQPSSG
ncbi:g3888 [Coccomyxa elongata]